MIIIKIKMTNSRAESCHSSPPTAPSGGAGPAAGAGLRSAPEDAAVLPRAAVCAVGPHTAVSPRHTSGVPRNVILNLLLPIRLILLYKKG